MQQYIIKKNKAFLRITSPSMDTTFEIDRDDITWLALRDWRLRANGTAIDAEDNVALHRHIFKQYSGWSPTKIEYIDKNPRNLKIENLRGIL